MENIGGFGEYLMDIYTLIRDNKNKPNKIGYAIRRINLSEDDIYPNEKYFKECFKSNETPENVLEDIHYHDEDLNRNITKFSDTTIKDEVSRRRLDNDILSDIDTDDLELELMDRYDATMVHLYDVNDEDLIDELARRRFDAIQGKSKLSIICDVLGLSNSFAYSKDEIIDEIKKLF